MSRLICDFNHMNVDKKREAECSFLTLDENSDQAMNYLENNQMQWKCSGDKKIKLKTSTEQLCIYVFSFVCIQLAGMCRNRTYPRSS